MAVYPKTLRKDTIPGEMEQRQDIARGYKVGPKGKQGNLIRDPDALKNYITYIYLPIGIVAILAACVIVKVFGPILVVATLLWGVGYFILAKIDGVKNVKDRIRE